MDDNTPTSLTPVGTDAAGASIATVSSPLTGITFADAPKMLPIDSRFSQAIQTIGFDVGLTCQQIEAYGWKTQPNEQTRVNNIFGATAEELARLGYSVLPQNPGSAAADITVYTAHRDGQDVLFTWSAGKAGLLLLLCDARTDVNKRGFGPAAGSVAYNGTAAAPAETPAMVGQPTDIVGEWPGTYSCIGQGPAGATLTVSRVKQDKSGYGVSGIFSFYPLSDKNPGMVSGSYRVSGRYDPIAHRALLEPAQWIQRPNGFTNAPLIAEFDIADQNRARVSALFQGTTGCTSFEGNYRADSAERAAAKYSEMTPVADTATTKKPAKKKAVKKAAPKVAPAATAADMVPVSPAAEAAPTESSATITTDTVTVKTAPAADVPGSTAATSPNASVTAAPAPATADVTPPSMGVPASATPAEAPVTVPAASPAAQ